MFCVCESQGWGMIIVVTCWSGYQHIMGSSILIKISCAPSAIVPQMGQFDLFSLSAS